MRLLWSALPQNRRDDGICSSLGVYFRDFRQRLGAFDVSGTKCDDASLRSSSEDSVAGCFRSAFLFLLLLFLEQEKCQTCSSGWSCPYEVVYPCLTPEIIRASHWFSIYCQYFTTTGSIYQLIEPASRLLLAGSIYRLSRPDLMLRVRLRNTPYLMSGTLKHGFWEKRGELASLKPCRPMRSSILIADTA